MLPRADKVVIFVHAGVDAGFRVGNQIVLHVMLLLVLVLMVVMVVTSLMMGGVEHPLLRSAGIGLRTCTNVLYSLLLWL